MKITIQKAALNEAIQHVSKAIGTKVTIPILAGIKVEAAGSGVTLTASDANITIQSFVPDVDVVQEGSIVLPAKFFVEIVKKLPKESVEMTLTNLKATIKSGKTELNLVGMNADEFPELPRLSAEKTFTINGAALKSLIKQTAYAVSTNESIPVLTGELWNISDGSLGIVSTDRHRLSRVQHTVEAADMKIDNLVIAGKTLIELSKTIPDNKEIQISASENQVLFKVGNILFYSRVLDGSYPDTSKIVSQEYKTEFKVNTKEFTDSLDRVYVMAKEEKTAIAKLKTVGSESIELSSSSGAIGNVIEQMDITNYVGDEIIISFNSEYMLDALKVINSEEIHIGFTGVMSPFIITPVGEVKSLHLILPYRTTT